METCDVGNLKLSRLMLGTVQFGLPYGVSNIHGQPSYDEVLKILDCAYQGGVNCLDTAPAYGQSEEILGKALSELGLVGQMTVITKVFFLADNLSPAAADKLVEESVVSSLRRLRLEILPLCLFHVEKNFCYIESLLKLKERGLVQHIGSSVMQPEAAHEMMTTDNVRALQIPANLFDHRFRVKRVLQDAQLKGVALFVRSIYLQGLLLMPEQDIPEDLVSVIPVRRELQSLAVEAGMTMSELAMRYVLSLNGITCAIVGVESVHQMRENIKLFSRGGLDVSLSSEVQKIVPLLPDAILLPNRWTRRMKDETPRN